MHGGLPPPQVFPFKSLGFSVEDGTSVSINDSHALMSAQQYAVISPQGYGPLLQWAKGQVHQLHNPPGNHDVVITTGSNGALEACMALLLDRGDSLLVEEFCYPHLLESVAVPKGYAPVTVPADGDGLLPAALEQVLAGWQEERQAPRPWLLYTVPVGHNPTGAVLPPERKRAVYNICRQYDVYIIEDDAYYYLQYPDGPDRVPGLSGLGPSFLSMDTDERVVRLDTFAKFLAPGLRVGWAAAPAKFCQKLVSQLMGSTLGPSSMSQVMVAQLLEAWGPGKLVAHVQGVQRYYGAKAALLDAEARTQLAGLAEWRTPAAGMFMWLRLLGVQDVSDIWEELVHERVIVVPGRIAHSRAADPHFKCPCVRLSYASASEEELVEGIRRLATVLRRHAKQQAAGLLHGTPAGTADATTDGSGP